MDLREKVLRQQFVLTSTRNVAFLLKRDAALLLGTTNHLHPDQTTRLPQKPVDACLHWQRELARANLQGKHPPN